MFDNIPIMPVTHFVYLTVTVTLTIWVGLTLKRHGRIFLAKGCKGNDELADSLSHLFSVGFYLLHIGGILLALRLGGYVTDTTSAIELLSTKVGLVLVVLAISHFTHVAIYSRIHGKPVPHYGPPRKEDVTMAEVVRG